MCLILVGWQAHPEHPLIVAANRDEFFARPTESAQFWAESPWVLAGRDLEAGGTWMGITRTGRFAALTNYRDLTNLRNNAPSRGKLVADFLTGQEAPEEYLERTAAWGEQCNGYNLLVGDGECLWWSSNVSGERRPLEPGIYGVSNHLLDTEWPKVAGGKDALAVSIKQSTDTEALFKLLQDDRIHADESLPNTGVGLEWERTLSPAFIKSPNYGTRSSTVLISDTNGSVAFDEQIWLAGGISGRRARFRFKAELPAGTRA